MFIGLDLLADEEALTPTYNSVNDVNKIIIKSAIYDEINIKERTDMPFDTNKTEWQYDNYLLAKFENNLNGGNVDFTGLTVAKLAIKRRKSEEFDWQTIKILDYDKNTIDYEFYDKYVEANQEYEYTIVPVTDGNVEGNYINIDKIVPEFEGAFLVDKNNLFKLLLNLEYNNTERVQLNEVYQPIGSKYPIIVSNGDINYEKGSLSALVLSNETLNDSSNIDKRQEKLLRKNLLNLLTNKKPMMLKDGNGNIGVISILGNPQINYLNNLGQSLANISFEWVEVADANDVNSLTINGLK